MCVCVCVFPKCFPQLWKFVIYSLLDYSFPFFFLSVCCLMVVGLPRFHKHIFYLFSMYFIFSLSHSFNTVDLHKFGF